MTVHERRDQLLRWMHLRPPCSENTIFRRTPLEMYSSIETLRRDLRALERTGRIRRSFTTRPVRWSLARSEAA
jgi:DeoR/GlpR family transcriptional regulator of sugar metabolism